MKTLLENNIEKIESYFISQLEKLSSIVDEKEKQKAIKKLTRKKEKDIENEKIEYEKIMGSKELDYCKINIEWKKSNTWGSNPHAEAFINNNSNFTAKVSGCGYCKESAVLADVLNQSLVIRKILTIAYNEGKTAYGMRQGRVSSGGVGVNSIEGAFLACGYKLTRIASGKTFDCFTIQKISETKHQN